MADTMTLKETYLQGKAILAKAGNQSPAFDAMCLFTNCFQMDRQQLVVHGQMQASQRDCAEFFAQIGQRAAGMPLQYILGEWEFMGMPFFVGEGVLVPREDTEVLVRECVRCVASLPCPVVLDLCGGSGAVAVGVASLLPGAEVTSMELSEVALHYLQKNIERNAIKNVTAVKGDVLYEEGRFAPASLDVLVSNPPYIPTEDLDGLQIEVQREPRMALDGGADGLLFYRAIAQRWLSRLKPGGTVAVEVGIYQARPVAALLEEQGVTNIRIVQDNNGIDRVVSGRVSFN